MKTITQKLKGLALIVMGLTLSLNSSAQNDELITKDLKDVQYVNLNGGIVPVYGETDQPFKLTTGIIAPISPCNGNCTTDEERPGITFEFQGFRSYLNSSQVTLVWNVREAEDKVTYIIEKSYNGHTFQPISAMNGIGYSLYSFQDYTFNGQRSYYRILAQEGGEVHFTDTVMMELEIKPTGGSEIIVFGGH